MLIHPAHRPETIPGVWTHPFPSHTINGSFGFPVFPGLNEKLRCNFPLPTTPAVGITDPSSMIGQVVYSGPVQTWNKQSCSLVNPHAFQKEFPPQSAISRKVYVEKSLGYGAFGVVWLVVDPRTGQQVALKRIPNVFESLQAAKRAYREMYLLLQLRHSNIVQLLDVVKTNDYADFNELSILCEFMDTDLHKIITSSQYLSIDHVKLFIYQILRGLKFMHSAGIIHRDLKPGNLLVNTNCLLKICDFGLARSAPLLDPEEPCDSLTMEVVTQFYRSPELLLGSCFYTSAIDLWSVGCILGELLTRRILFQSMSPFRQLDMIFDLLGSPTPMDLVDLVGCPSLSIEFLLSRPVRPANHAALVTLVRPVPRPSLLSSPNPFDQPPDPDLLALLLSLLKFSPSKRVSAEDALKSPFVAAGRARFHSSACSCCPHTLCPPGPSAVTYASATARPFVSTATGPVWMDLLPVCGGPLRAGALNSANTLSSSSPCTPPSPYTPPHLVGPAELMLGLHQFGLRSTGFPSQPLTIPPPLIIPPQIDLEPVYTDVHGARTLNTEVRMDSLEEAKSMLWNLIEYYFQRDPHRARVVINNSSPSFGSFIASTVAHA